MSYNVFDRGGCNQGGFNKLEIQRNFIGSMNILIKKIYKLVKLSGVWRFRVYSSQII